MNISRPLLCLFAIVLLCLSQSNAAHAYSCDWTARTHEIEREFIQSDVVFSGVLKNTINDSLTFSINEFYKTPDNETSQKKELSVVSASGLSSEMANSVIGQEWIVFADKDSVGNYVFSSCGMTDFSPEARIHQVKNWNKNPKVSEARDVVLVFTGKIRSVSHRIKDSLSHRSHPVSTYDFEVDDLIRNTSHIDIGDGKKITIESSFCGEKFQLGHRYLMFALEGYHRAQNPKDPAKIERIENFEALCTRLHFFDLDIKDILRDLGKIYKK